MFVECTCQCGFRVNSTPKMRQVILSCTLTKKNKYAENHATARPVARLGCGMFSGWVPKLETWLINQGLSWINETKRPFLNYAKVRRFRYKWCESFVLNSTQQVFLKDKTILQYYVGFSRKFVTVNSVLKLIGNS